MDEEFCLVPVRGERSPEAGSLLADCFIGYSGNSAAKGITRFFIKLCLPDVLIYSPRKFGPTWAASSGRKNFHHFFD